MTKKEAKYENDQAAARIMNPRRPNDPDTKPIDEMIADLLDGISKAANREGEVYVTRRLEWRDDLRLALTVPTTIVWYEDTGKTVLDPMSGNPRPQKVRKRDAAKCNAKCMQVKDYFTQYLRALTILAKRISSPAYDAMRECYVSLEAWFAEHRMSAPMDETFVDELLEKFIPALFSLAIDVEIMKEV